MSAVKRDDRSFVHYEGRMPSAVLALVVGCLSLVGGGVTMGVVTTMRVYDRVLARLVEGGRGEITRSAPTEVASLAEAEEARRKAPKPKPDKKDPPEKPERPDPDDAPKRPDPAVGRGTAESDRFADDPLLWLEPPRVNYYGPSPYTTRE